MLFEMYLRDGEFCLKITLRERFSNIGGFCSIIEFSYFDCGLIWIWFYCL